MYPKRFLDIVEMFEKLPGVGNKTALRFSFDLLNKKEEEITNYIEILKNIKDIKKCKTCNFLCDEEECLICKDDHRDKNTIMIVAYPQDVIAIEKTDNYHGLYHVLGSLLSPSKGIYPEDIEIESFLNRLNDDIKEIIIALSPTMDGEMTALYIDKILKDKNILVTRIAHGLPMGSNLDYADELTIIKALNNRRKVEE